jgi:hypothetical protein
MTGILVAAHATTSCFEVRPIVLGLTSPRRFPGGQAFSLNPWTKSVDDVRIGVEMSESAL